MKRIIYSIYTNTVNNHSSVNDFKKSQFEKYKKQIKKSQEDYAKWCNADYKLYKTRIVDYDKIQFEKILLFEKLSKEYDEVLYFDFDVVPQTRLNIFNEFDLNTICAYSLNRFVVEKNIRKKLINDAFDRMNMWIKTCCKSAMLLLDDIQGSQLLMNTGVLLGNRNSISKLKFSERLNKLNKKYNDAVKDNLYPEEINKWWKPNNEVYMSYLIERYNIPFTNIGLQWNFMLDDYSPKPSSAAHVLHHIRKEFELSFA